MSPTRQELANAIRVLAMDAVEKAQSGHPGAPMGMADMAQVVWADCVKHNPNDPHWVDRDRVILSNGHGSMLLYAVLHLTGYDLSIDDLKNFRQMHSKTPGHPEYGYTPGVEMTTGPLGQGIASAVGFALAEKMLAAHFNRPSMDIIDHHTYVFLGDGCLMEGLSHEACSYAGTLGLGKLIALWDDNGISIDGPVEGWFTDDTPQRFKSYGWHVITDVDGHDGEAIKKALAKAKRETSKPSLICCRTTIGKGAGKKAGTAGIHGSPLGSEEIALARKNLHWEHPPFHIPQEIYAGWDARQAGATAQKKWEKLFAAYAETYPGLGEEFTRRMKGTVPENSLDKLAEYITAIQATPESLATRVASQKALDVLGPLMPELLGGSADLTGSVGTRWKGSKNFDIAQAEGDYISYGVREFGMSCLMNGLALHGGYIPYAGTFLIFSDYAKNALRLAALMEKRVIWVLTHDSIGVGEDGPTHQPIEQLIGLRSIPNMHVWRPCDAVETAIAWKKAITRQDGPSCLSLTRQGVPTLARTEKMLVAVEKGAYIIRKSKKEAQGLLIATGSEVALAVAAAEKLEAEGKHVTVVSMPCAELFAAQDAAYRNSVLPPQLTARLAIEAAHVDYWYKYVGLEGDCIGMNSFGESAPGKELFSHFGFTVANICTRMKALLKD